MSLADDGPPPPPMTTRRRRIPRPVAQLLPWVVALGVLAWVARSVDPHAVWQAFGRAAPSAIPVLAAVIAVLFLADALATWKTFAWFCAPLSYQETVVVRGAAYLLAMVNYALGQGAFAWFLHRSRGVPLLRCAATVLLVMGINVLVLLFLSTAGVVTAPDAVPALKSIVLVAYAGLAVYITLVALRPRWLAGRPLFDVLLSAGLRGHARALLVRLPHIGVLVAFTILNLRAFGIVVPLAQALLLLPPIYFVAVLPIAPQGLGTSQFMMVLLLSRFVPAAEPDPKALVFAASLFGQAIATSVQLGIGLICLRSHLGRSIKPGAASDETSAEAIV